MGVYINPTKQTKEEWLATHAKIATANDMVYPQPPESALLCHVDNGPFTALAVITSKYEYRTWIVDRSMRPKIFYVANKKAVMQLTGLRESDFEE